MYKIYVSNTCMYIYVYYKEQERKIKKKKKDIVKKKHLWNSSTEFILFLFPGFKNLLLITICKRQCWMAVVLSK